MCSRSGAHFCRIAAAAAAAAAAPAAADAAVCQAPRARWLSRLLVFARSEMGLGRACASGSAGRGWTERVLVTRSRARGWLHASVRPERKCVRARVSTCAQICVCKTQANPELLHAPQMKFLKDYIESFGGKVPPIGKHARASVPASDSASVSVPEPACVRALPPGARERERRTLLTIRDDAASCAKF